jgi:hypothetical protein
MTWLALNESGMSKLSIVEAAQRLGGRVHTAYFGDRSERQYQEMGPMRFPLSYTSSETNETVQINDHRIVFQLAGKSGLVLRRHGWTTANTFGLAPQPSRNAVSLC